MFCIIGCTCRKTHWATEEMIKSTSLQVRWDFNITFYPSWERIFFVVSEADVYAGVNTTEETSTEFVSSSSDFTERPRSTHTNTNHGTSANDNCNASTPPMKVFPQEVHHYHHHFFGGAPNGACSPMMGGQFPNNANGGFTQSSGGGPGGSTGFNFPSNQEGQQGGGGASASTTSSIQQLQNQMKQVW